MDPTAPVLYDSSQKRVILPGEPGYAIPPAGTVSIISHGAYVDIGYLNTSYSAAYNYDITLTPNGSTHLGLGHWGHPRSGLGGTVVGPNFTPPIAQVYDTYSFHYECDGVRQSTAPASTGTVIDAATNGFDDNNNGVVDDIVYNGDPTAGENETAPPYPVTLRGIQVKIRTFEPDSRQILEWTVVQDFLPQ